MPDSSSVVFHLMLYSLGLLYVVLSVVCTVSALDAAVNVLMKSRVLEIYEASTFVHVFVDVS